MQREPIKKKSFKRKPTLNVARTQTFSLARSRSLTNYTPLGRRDINALETAITADPVIASNTWSAGTLLNNSAVGTGLGNRIGRKILMTKLYLRYRVELADTAVGGSPIRILIVYDKQTNGAAPAITDILVGDSMTAFNNLSNKDRFVTIVDFLTEPVDANGPRSISGFIVRKINLDTTYNAGTANTVADITTGSVYLFTAQTGTVSVVTPNVSGSVRIRFLDN